MIPVLLVFPNVGWETGWGKVISTLAQTNAAYTFDQEPLDYLILSRFSPQEAMGLTMLAIWCLSVMTGVVSYAGNFLVHRGFGIVINCGIALTALLLSKFSSITIGYYCAPPLWMNIASYKWQGVWKRAVDSICLQCLCNCHRRMHDPFVSRDPEKGSELCGGNLKEWKKKIRIENVTKKFGDYAALDGISLSFEKGKIHGMIGRNGSGKTVLFKCICGFLRVDDGAVFVDGKQIGKEIEAPESIGAIIETPGFLPGYSARQNLQFLAGIRRGPEKRDR